MHITECCPKKNRTKTGETKKFSTEKETTKRTDNILPFQLELKVSYIIVGWLLVVFIRRFNIAMHCIFRNFRFDQILFWILLFFLTFFPPSSSSTYSHFHFIWCVFSFIKQFVSFLLFKDKKNCRTFFSSSCKASCFFVFLFALFLSICLVCLFNLKFHCGFMHIVFRILALRSRNSIVSTRA